MAILEPITTSLSEQELLFALLSGHAMAWGSAPSLRRMGVGWAQAALETGRGRAITHYNVGNVTAGPHWTGDQYLRVCSEQVHPGVWKDVEMHFRAYSSQGDGCADYWSFLRDDRFAKALMAFDEGNARQAAEELSAERYFTQNLAPYASAMVSLAAYFWAKLLPLVGGAPALVDRYAVPPLAPGEELELGDAAAACLLEEEGSPSTDREPTLPPESPTKPGITRPR